MDLSELCLDYYRNCIAQDDFWPTGQKIPPPAGLQPLQQSWLETKGPPPGPPWGGAPPKSGGSQKLQNCDPCDYYRNCRRRRHWRSAPKWVPLACNQILATQSLLVTPLNRGPCHHICTPQCIRGRFRSMTYEVTTTSSQMANEELLVCELTFAPIPKTLIDANLSPLQSRVCGLTESNQETLGKSCDSKASKL